MEIWVKETLYTNMRDLLLLWGMAVGDPHGLYWKDRYISCYHIVKVTWHCGSNKNVYQMLNFLLRLRHINKLHKSKWSKWHRRKWLMNFTHYDTKVVWDERQLNLVWEYIMNAIRPVAPSHVSVVSSKPFSRSVELNRIKRRYWTVLNRMGLIK